MTRTDYVNRKRVGAPLPLLAATQLPVSVIAAQVGYKDENCCVRVFKKLQGISPGE